MDNAPVAVRDVFVCLHQSGAGSTQVPRVRSAQVAWGSLGIRPSGHPSTPEKMS